MFNRNKKPRKMKKIFQWREYLNWDQMSYTQKINFKRACLFPILVFIIYKFLLKFSIPILIIIGIYFLIKFKDRNRLIK